MPLKQQVVFPLLLSLILCGCTASPGMMGARFTSTGALLMDGPSARMTEADIAQERADVVPLLYQFAIDSGQISPLTPLPPGVDTISAKEDVLFRTPLNWRKVTAAGENYVDRQCLKFKTALDDLERARITSLKNLNTIQSATIGMMGLLKAAQQTIGLTGIAFGLAASLFDQTTSTVLYELPAFSVKAVIDAQRQSLRNEELDDGVNLRPSLEWQQINDRSSASARIYNYVQYCAPVTIEANIAKILNKTAIDTAGNLVVTATQPATMGAGPAPVQLAPALPPAPPPAPSLRPGPVVAPPVMLDPSMVPRPVTPKPRPLVNNSAGQLRSGTSRCQGVVPQEVAQGKVRLNSAIVALGEKLDKPNLDSIYGPDRLDLTTQLGKPAPKNAVPEANVIVAYIQDHVCTSADMDNIQKRLNGIVSF